MSTLTLPAELDAWIQSEVAAGRAESPNRVVEKALEGYRHQIEALRKSLDDAVAEADRDGWLDAGDIFAKLKAEYPLDGEV